MINSRVILFHGEKTKQTKKKTQQYHDFPRYHIVIGTFHFSLTLYEKKKKGKKSTETHQNIPPCPLNWQI